MTNSVLPIVNGSFFHSFDVARDGSVKPTMSNNRPVILRLDIVDDAYVSSDVNVKDASKKQSTLKLSHVPLKGDSKWRFWVVMHSLQGSYIYTALVEQDGSYIEYMPLADARPLSALGV